MTFRAGFMRFRSLTSLIILVAAGSVTFTLMSVAFSQSVLVPHSDAIPLNSLTVAASNVGVQQCLPHLADVSGLGLQGTTKNDVLFDWDRKRFGGGPVFALLGMEYSRGSAALTVAAVPESDGSCSIAAERISVAHTSCETVAHQELSDYRVTQLLGHMLVYTRDKEPGSSISLIDDPPVCLVIRRFVKLSWGTEQFKK